MGDFRTMVIISAVSAALLAGTFALVGAHQGERRGRREWVRNKRLEAAAEYLTQIDRTIVQLSVASSGLPFPPLAASELPQIFTELVERQSVMTLLGPDEVIEAAKQLTGKALTLTTIEDAEARQREGRAARDAFISAARQSLRDDPAV